MAAARLQGQAGVRGRRLRRLHYDLGEVRPKGTVPPPYGTRRTTSRRHQFHAAGIQRRGPDIVPNHHVGGDGTGSCAPPVDPTTARAPSVRPGETTWTRYTFQARRRLLGFHLGPGSSTALTGTGRTSRASWLFEGKQWNERQRRARQLRPHGLRRPRHQTHAVSAEMILGALVRGDNTGVDDLRLDALHPEPTSSPAGCPSAPRHRPRPASRGRYEPATSPTELPGGRSFHEPVRRPLRFHLHAASTSNGDVDLSRLGTLVASDPEGVPVRLRNWRTTTQPGQSLASPSSPGSSPLGLRPHPATRGRNPHRLLGDPFGARDRRPASRHRAAAAR